MISTPASPETGPHEDDSIKYAWERKRNKRGLSRCGRALNPSRSLPSVSRLPSWNSVRHAFGSNWADFRVANAPVPWRRVQAAWSPRVSRRMTAVLS